MTKCVIYKNDAGGISVIYPTPEAINLYGIDVIAQKDTPAGVRYAIIDADQLPTDRTFRAAWEVDESLLTYGVGAEFSSFEETAQ